MDTILDLQPLYEEIGRNNGVGAENVEQEISAALAAAWESGNAFAVPAKGPMPTNEEFFEYLLEILQ